MIIKFIVGENSVQSDKFNQGNIDYFYEEFISRYTKRFIGQLNIVDDQNISSFLEANSQDISITFIDDNNIEHVELNSGRLSSINKDYINGVCRIDIKEINNK